MVVWSDGTVTVGFKPEAFAERLAASLIGDIQFGSTADNKILNAPKMILLAAASYIVVAPTNNKFQ